VGMVSWATRKANSAPRVMPMRSSSIEEKIYRSQNHIRARYDGRAGGSTFELKM
jgi:hypothetical protein